MSTLEQIISGKWFERDMVTEESVILNKELLTDEQCDRLIALYKESPKLNKDINNKMASYAVAPDDIINDIIIKLQNYVVIEKISPNIGFKEYKFGGMSEHTDTIYFDETIQKYSIYTLIIYLNDCDNGETAIKRKKFRAIDDNKLKKHERIFVKPKKGHCVLFNSQLSHYACDTFNSKLIAHLRIY